jgi:hypothetical protein
MLVRPGEPATHFHCLWAQPPLAICWGLERDIPEASGSRARKSSGLSLGCGGFQPQVAGQPQEEKLLQREAGRRPWSHM